MRPLSYNSFSHPPPRRGAISPRTGSLWRRIGATRPPPLEEKCLSPDGTIGSGAELREFFDFDAGERANFENAFGTASCASIPAFEPRNVRKQAMINRTFSIVLLVVAFAAAGLAQTPCTRYAAADFSICQPAGWTAADSKDGGFKTISSSDSTANVNFNEEAHPLKLSEYVDSTNKYTLEHVSEIGFTSVSLLSRSAFVTDANATGVRSVFLEEFQGKKLCGFQYIFDTGKNKLLVTFTTYETERAAGEKLFDDTVKTLKIERGTP